jgi:DNA repair ATPase RecN
MNEVDLLSDDWPDSGQQPPIRPPNERHVDIKPVNNGEINEEDLLVKVASSTTSQSTSKTMQHDLEKLQEAHDKLMHEIEEKRLFIVKMHEQLDRVVEENNNLKLEMEEKENDLRSVASKLTSQESLRKELTETQDKMNKLKQLASKYKKELLESKEEGERRKASAAQEVKDATRDLQKEVDKVNAVYQQSVRNFQVCFLVVGVCLHCNTKV